MKINVRLFAAAREIAGRSDVSVTVPDPTTSADVKEALAETVPELAELIQKSALAVDNHYVNDQFEIAPDSDVALIPPVSGG